MRLITRETDYAVRALLYMARCQAETISVSELVSALKIPRAFLRRIMQSLNKEGLIESFKGKGGGFRLALPLKKIFLIDLMEKLQGPVKLNECLFKKRICPDRNRCLLKKKIDALEKEMIAKLRAITLASLAGSYRKL